MSGDAGGGRTGAPAIAPEDPGAADIRALLDAHLALMRATSPPGSVHALDLGGLRAPGVTFYAARSLADGTLLGVGALKRLDQRHAEIKSMHVAAPHRGRGVARAILDRLTADAERAGYIRLSLETGSPAPFHPAIALYERAGFARCGPFADYVPDPFSVFMTRTIGAPGDTPTQ